MNLTVGEAGNVVERLHAVTAQHQHGRRHEEGKEGEETQAARANGGGERHSKQGSGGER